ncbi:MAG: DUF1194 domain-containing protein [Acidobacteriia bacterium]|nr:DUF1194 domain-containing protein [Methyloceanibacter sp.]MCL6492748.1 DUF1194 domain-containing protein [Terriglobia bacterium]
MVARLMLLALMLFYLPAAGPAAEAVDVALVLVSDVSRSIDDAEFALEKQGYYAAFTDPRVIQAIHAGPAQAIAASYVEFAGTGQVRTLIGWTVIRDGETARDFAERLATIPRSDWGATAIGEGIAHAVQNLKESGLKAAKSVIDVCGDGTSNQGEPVEAARDRAIASGITINGLVIINDHPLPGLESHVAPPGGLAKYYREHVIGGERSFVVEVHNLKDFGRAMTRKLLEEIAQKVGRGAVQWE